MGKMTIIRIGKNQKPNVSFVMPIQLQNGLDNQADAEPVMAKTIKTIIS
jgi:hypothetical protein